jgi:hypothetical protein
MIKRQKKNSSIKPSVMVSATPYNFFTSLPFINEDGKTPKMFLVNNRSLQHHSNRSSSQKNKIILYYFELYSGRNYKPSLHQWRRKNAPKMFLVNKKSLQHHSNRNSSQKNKIILYYFELYLSTLILYYIELYLSTLILYWVIFINS